MFEDYLAVLAVILMAKHGNKIVVTQDEIADARRALADNEIQAVAYDTDRLVCGDRVAIEFRYRSRRVLEGEVVWSADPASAAKPGGMMPAGTAREGAR